MKNKKLLLSVVAIIALGLGSAFWPKAKPEATVKQSDVSIGVMQFVTHAALDEIYNGVKDGLRDRGYGDAKIHFYNPQADQSKMQTMADKMVNQDNDVLIGIATPAAQALANATSTTPIIMGAVTDPVGANLIKNPKAPEGNITGVSDQFPVEKQVQLMSDLMPSLKTVGVLYSSSEDNSKSQVEAFKTAAQAKGMSVKEYAVSNTNDISATMNVLASQVEALYIPTDNTIASAFSTVVQVAKEAKLPVFPSVDSMVKEGGLAAVAIDQYQLGVATGDMAADVLDGVAIKDLPVNFFTDVTPMINETVAKELGIIVPDSVKETATLVK